MASEFTPAFRATAGLDAAGEKVINVAKADFNTLSDGVNVDFFIEENTIQQYKETRGYRKDFAVIQDNRIWVSNRDIPAPAGPFQELFWTAVRTDAKWALISGPVYQLKSGEFITIDSNASNYTLSLPANPEDGDTISIKDIGNNAGYNEIRIDATNQNIVRFGQQVARTRITKPLSYSMLIYSNRLWNFYETANEERAVEISVAGGDYRAQAGDVIARRYIDDQPVTVILPKYANQGDLVHTVDIDKLGPLYHLIVKTSDPSISVGRLGQTEAEFRTSGDGFFMYNELDNLWVVYDSDLNTRLRVVKEDIKLMPNESITIMGDNNTDSQTIIVDFPTSVAIGDTVKVAMNYLRKKQTVILRAAPNDKILTRIELLQFPKRSEYPPDATWVTSDTLEFNGDTNYTPVIEFSYIEESGRNVWVVAQNVPTVERVDPKDNNTRKRLGVISLASQDEANLDYEVVGINKEAAITPETLANRFAREDRRGIARIATSEQVMQPTTFNFVDDVIITPKKLNDKQATEEMRGVAEIATQTETNAGVNDRNIVTPKKLQERQGTESLSGIVKYVPTTGTTPAVTRDAIGTNVYDNRIDNLVISPKALSQYKATEFQQGAVYISSQSEVDTGQTAAGFANGAVSPETLNARRASDTNHGLIEIATQTEVNDGTDNIRAVTPKTLNDRKATQTLTGIARIATQTEFDSGELDTVISTPLKVKTRFNDPLRTSVNSDSGLVETGTLWDHYTLDIEEASESQRGTLKLSSQALTDAGLDDTTAVTPLKLQKKKATEGVEGIIQVATQVETATGTNGLKAVPPVHLKHVIQVQKEWEASPTLRGPVKISEGPITWVGDNTNGSSANVESFEKTGYAISPYELNKTLTHYLPIEGKAFDSDKLDGLDSSQFIRKDIDQDVDGIISFKKQVNLAAPLVSTSTGSFTGNVDAGTLSTKGPITVQNGTNVWKVTAPENGTTLTFGNATNVLTLNTDSGNAAVLNNISAGNLVSAKTGFNLDGRPAVSLESGKIAFGNTQQSAMIKAANASVVVNDGTTDYKVLTEKNMTELVGNEFVKKIGDTMSGNLNVNASVRVTRTVTNVNAAPTADNVGFWSADISTKALYDLMPGVWTRLPNGERDEEIKSPGTLTQFGNTIETTYQDWVTHPLGNDVGTARYTRTWQANKNAWSAWGMVYTDTNRPSASEVGAVPSTDASFQNLTVRDWLQIGQVRIEPDPVTRTLKFTWIDI